MNDHDVTGLRATLGLARRHVALLLIVPLLAAAVGWGVSRHEQRQYEATAILLAGQGAGQLGTLDEVQSATQAAVALAGMATDPVVVQNALDALGDHSDPARDVAERASTSVPTNTQEIELTVRDPSPTHAADLANAIAGSFAAMVTRGRVARLNLSATVWQTASVPTSPASPNVPINVAAAMLIGILIASSLAYASDTLDSAWRDEDDLERDLDLRVLAVIPDTRRAFRRRAVIGA